jgi:uncharacterized RDD family membrane protein YckC
MTEIQVTCAGFWKRFAAYFLDSTLLVFATGPSYFLLLNLMGTFLRYDDPYRQTKMITSVTYSVIWIFVSWSYYAGMESSPLRATLGKLAVGIHVIADDGHRLSFAKATGRFFGKIISLMIVGIGFFMAAWTTRKQALHDIMAGTLVVETEK